MIEKCLGKIDFAEYGTIKDYPFMIGLQLGFSCNNWGVFDGGKYTVNISDHCDWEKGELEATITIRARELCKILKEAKCNYVSELIGKPVQVTVENGVFKDFRILTEVL
jgi:hypothetical protein